MANYNNPFFCLFLFYLKIQFVFILLFALIPIFGIEVEAYHLDFSSALQPSLLP